MKILEAVALLLIGIWILITGWLVICLSERTAYLEFRVDVIETWVGYQIEKGVVHDKRDSPIL